MGGIFPACDSLTTFKKKIFNNDSLLRTWPETQRFNKRIRSSVCGMVTLEEAQLKAINSQVLQDYPETYEDLTNKIPESNLATADVGSIWAMRSSLDAVEMSGWSEREKTSEATGVVIGSGSGGHEILRKSWNNFFESDKKTRHLGVHNVDRAMVYRDAANVSCLIQSKGVCESIGSACACGLGNIGYAYRLIKFGLQDRVLAGGTEATSLETFLGFDAMCVLSSGKAPEKSSRPFDIDRNGFVCSFGCGIVALEEYHQARDRGARVLAVIDSYFNNSDGDGDMFAPSFDGQQRLWRGLKQQFAGKDFNPDVVSVHGTSTPSGDALEFFSIVSTLGESDYYLSAPKSQVGHMLGAAGAVEFIMAVLMLQEQVVLPCLNADNLNEKLESFQKSANWKGVKKPMSSYRNLIPTEAFDKDIKQVACLNYGFGGTNSAALISHGGSND